MAVERFTELSAEGTAAHAAEDGARYGSKRNADWPSNSTEDCTGLAAGQGSADTACYTTDCADSGAGFHGGMEGGDLGGVAFGGHCNDIGQAFLMVMSWQ